MRYFLFSLTFSINLFANPYPDPTKIINPKNHFSFQNFKTNEAFFLESKQVLRVDIEWKSDESCRVKNVFIEKSGTEALMKSSLKKDSLGSYQAKLTTDQSVFYSSIGTGKEFRKLVRVISFRFPYNASSHYQLNLDAENPQTGKMENVLDVKLNPDAFEAVAEQNVKVTLLRAAKVQPSLKVNFYAEGFDAFSEKKFLNAAKTAITTFDEHLPGSEAFEYRAVFAPSNQKIGSAQDLGPEIKVRDSFLGLYFPFWRKFGRWYHVVYPTDETKYRNALAQLDYDYPIALVDDAEYWGVGNYKELTAVPINNYRFSYLLLHEFGHFMGLNEEYEGGGPTELEFAPLIKEPWSQNITFNPTADQLKWLKQTESGISLPTSAADYTRFGGSKKNPIGAYAGGYADSAPSKKSHKPVMQCMMSSGGDFCGVCENALKSLINFDRGMSD